MIDIFLQKDVSKLIKNKNIVFMGDSNTRALYKDFLCLSKQTRFIPLRILQTKVENSCFGDRLLTDGPKYNGRSFREERRAEFNGTTISYYFLTNVYERYVEDILHKIASKSNSPDVLIINSCLWDVTRWGPRGVEMYKENLEKLMKELKRLIPDCLVIWITTPPIAQEVKGGFLVKELDFLKYSLRFHIMEANCYARKVVTKYGFDILDSHYHLKMQLHRRSKDGIHWMPDSVRYVTNLILAHISIAWNIALPGRYKANFIGVDSEVPVEDNPKIISSTAEKKPQMASVIKKPRAVKHELKEDVVEVKIEKENFIKRPKRLTKKISKFQESHYAYLNRVEHRQRQRRIKQWQLAPLLNTPPREYFDNLYARPYTQNYNQHDSGYFPSPQQMSHHSPLQMSHHSPQQMSQHSPQQMSHHSAQQMSHHSAQQMSHHSAQQSPQFASPHLYVTLNEQMYFPSPSQIPLPLDSSPYQQNSPKCSYIPKSNRTVIYSSPIPNRQPYVFPDINQQPHPVIDFTSTNVFPFGIQF